MINEQALLIKLTLSELDCNQKQLAKRLNVSETQISKWKKGEHMSRDFESKLTELSGVGWKQPSACIAAGSVEDLQKWELLVGEAYGIALAGVEHGWEIRTLDDELESFTGSLIVDLVNLGVDIPRPFPKELEKILDEDGDNKNWAELELGGNDEQAKNGLFDLLQEIMRTYVDIYGFYAAFISELTLNEDLFELGIEVEDCLRGLAIYKTDIDPAIAPNCQFKKNQMFLRACVALSTLKEQAINQGVVLKAEIMDLLESDHYSLSLAADGALGSGLLMPENIHPDVYMNELLYRARQIDSKLDKIMLRLHIN
jgi:transcriptional regulator with XRE-family HTH domain